MRTTVRVGFAFSGEVIPATLNLPEMFFNERGELNVQKLRAFIAAATLTPSTSLPLRET